MIDCNKTTIFKENQKLLKIFISFLLITVLLSYLNSIISIKNLFGDQFERARIVGKIIETENYPVNIEIYKPTPKNNYPPLTDMLLSIFVIMSDIEIINILKTISAIALLLIIFIITQLILKKEDIKVKIFITISFLLTPWITRLIIIPLAETLGVILFLINIYLIKDGKEKLLVIFLPILLLTHIRTFILFCLLLAISLINKVILEKKNFGHIKHLVISFLIAIIIFLAIFGLPKSPIIKNFWVLNYGVKDVLSLLFFVGITIISFLVTKIDRLKNYEKEWIFFTILILAFYLIRVSGENSFRLITYTAFFLCYFTIKTINKKTDEKISAIIITFFTLGLFATNTVFYENFNYDKELIDSINFLKKYEHKVILSDYSTSYLIPYYTKNKVVIGAFLESLEDANERALLSYNAFHDCEKFENLLDKYDIDIVFIKSEFRYFKINECAHASKKLIRVYYTERAEIYEKKKDQKNT
ncbi:MAG: hypothetical protein N3D73_00405 [Candidatus Diapherotrites archaeon]|nr:hypothetical protein [Candidatus Diapherotrites archaeon]